MVAAPPEFVAAEDEEDNDNNCDEDDGGKSESGTQLAADPRKVHHQSYLQGNDSHVLSRHCHLFIDKAEKSY